MKRPAQQWDDPRSNQGPLGFLLALFFIANVVLAIIAATAH